MAREVAVGEDSGQFAIGIDDSRSTGAAFGHFLEHLHYFGVGIGHRHARRFAHDLTDAGKQDPAEAAARMETREVFLVESARLEQNHGQGIAEGEHGCRAGGRGEIERACLLTDGNVEHDVEERRASRRATSSGNHNFSGMLL